MNLDLDEKSKGIFKSIDALGLLIELDNNNKLLKKEYKELCVKYKELAHDYSENTVIQSMNDMKNDNEILNKNLEKYKECFYYSMQSTRSIDIMIDTLMESTLNNSLKNKFQFIKDVLEESTRKRNNIIYNNSNVGDFI